MGRLVFSFESIVWLVLMSATGLSWWLGVDHGLGQGMSTSVVGVAILLVAYVKVRLVIRHFMEVKGAPLALCLLTDAWVVVSCSSLLGLYLAS